LDAISTICRTKVAALFLVSGAIKLTGVTGVVGYIASKGLPAPELLAYATIGLELIGGVLLILNRGVSAVALLFAAFCIATAVIFHPFWSAAPADLQDNLNHFLKNIALAGALILVAREAWRETSSAQSPMRPMVAR